MLGGKLGNPMDMMINSFLGTKGIDMVNRKVGRYGRVTALHKDGEGYHAVVRLLGYNDDIEVTMLNLDVDEECSKARLGKFRANMPWLEHLLEDHVEGREIPIPEGQIRMALKPFRKYL